MPAADSRAMLQKMRPWYRYYLCSRGSRRVPVELPDGTLKYCTNKAVRGDGVDEVVWTTVRDLLLDDRALAELSFLVTTYGVASEHVTLGFDDLTGAEDGFVEEGYAMGTADKAAGCSCATPIGLAGGLPLGLVALVAVRRRRR